MLFVILYQTIELINYITCYNYMFILFVFDPEEEMYLVFWVIIFYKSKQYNICYSNILNIFKSAFWRFVLEGAMSSILLLLLH